MNTKLILAAIAALALASAQAFAEGGAGEHKGHAAMEHKGHAGMDKGHMNCPHQAKDVKTERKTVKDGVEITMTTENPEEVAGLREKAAAEYASKECPMMKGSKEVRIENIGKGVKVTITGKDQAAIKKLQASAKPAKSCCPEGGHEKTASAKSSKKYAYICPMGCEGSGSDKPGKCPKCGMNLVKSK